MEEEAVSRRARRSADFDCSICLSEVEGPVVTQCGHLFCWGCLYGWGAKSSICPVCKHACSLGSVVPIYSKGASAFPGHLPKPPLPGPVCAQHERVMSIEYSERVRILHMEGVEYRRGAYVKPCFFTRVFYVLLLIFCLGAFLLLE